jgi:MoxR-like ATPase
MPSDITGFTLVNFKTGEMEYKEGAVMSQIILADEINRTSPKTQSALLEVMEEHQVTVDGVTHPLPQPFIVLATQNPGEFVGTYPLPEAQVDRFFLRISIGYPTVEQEMDVLERYSGVVRPMETITPVCTAQDILAMQEQVATIYCSPEVRSYVAHLAAATRENEAFQLGASTRAAIALIRGAQACALLDDRDFVLPEDVQHMLLPVFAHRMVLSPEARMKGVQAEDVLVRIMRSTEVPVRL